VALADAGRRLSATRHVLALDCAFAACHRKSPHSRPTTHDRRIEGPAAVIGVLTSPHPDTLALKADSPFTMLGLVDDAEWQRLLEVAYAA
jgi:hypothetical protein